MDFGQILDSKSYDQVYKYASMQVCKYVSIHIYANKREAIYMSAVAAFFGIVYFYESPPHSERPLVPY